MSAIRSSMRRAGFTIIELLIVIALIAFLATISIVSIGNFLTSAREAATRATISKLDRLVQDRLDAAHRHLGRGTCIETDDSTRSELSLKVDEAVWVMRAALSTVQSSMAPGALAKFSDKKSCFWKILARKQAMREWFPQSFNDIMGINGVPGQYGVDDDGQMPTATDTFAANVPDIRELGLASTEYLDPMSSSAMAGVPTPVRDAPQFAAVFQRMLAADSTLASKFSSNHQPHTASSALLYLMLTQVTVFGVPPVDDSEFTSAEVKDTDGDGFLEFVDAWGNPFRFYRWPTALFYPGVDADNNGVYDALPMGFTGVASPGLRSFLVNSTPREEFARLLNKTLPAKSALDASPYNRDPDDGYGRIYAQLKRLATIGDPPALDTSTLLQLGAAFESVFHTPDTYHSYLIMSPGVDGAYKANGGAEGLGLYEPYDRTNFGHLAAPDVKYLNVPLAENPLNDNLTNRNR